MIEEIDAELIDSLFNDAIEYRCTCAEKEHGCKFCSKWSKAVKTVEQLVSERDLLKTRLKIAHETIEEIRASLERTKNNLANLNRT